MPAKKKAAKKAAVKKAAVKKTAVKKAAVKKAAVKKTPIKKAPAKKAAVKKPASTVAVKEAMTKSQILNEIAEATELNRKQVQAVLDELGTLIQRHIKKRAVGEFSVPGLMKITVKSKPAQKARKGINPFTGEETMFKAKPASRQVKIRPLKKLKDMAES